MPTIKPFLGRRDGIEDPEHYLEDIEYAIKIEKSHVDSDSTDWNHDRRILFRQNLRGRAELWYSQLGRDLKNDWERLKREFTKRYRIDEVDAATRRFQITQKVATLSQGPNEHILDYVNRCEDLESQAGTLESFGLNVVQGLADRAQKQQIMYDLFKGKDYSFGAAKDLINAASGRRVPNKFRLDDHSGEKDGISAFPMSMLNLEIF
ncbi:hypothetical protein Asppvi_009077 [Aspergillus pseudoviridinutans]|uniref:Retrotransposon gag domain-containing protein n=1 Tax=Aspergillus pseudoviridinutans TaxID=1517512 RepID=A0A9P3EY30_9EURO|nr:uncharacterized protein Asppvi_009077 [Aspergillus pseudoviridinutans]GIJ90127.1 hypothetical protein Asppvi_009077 [Aspergillus pseudoviridinutans]